MIAGLSGVSILPSRAIKLNNQSQNVISLTDSDVPMDLPMTSKKGPSSGGGGGGGDRDKLDATKGKLPRLSMQQLAPPAVVVRNDNPKLVGEPPGVVRQGIKTAS